MAEVVIHVKKKNYNINKEVYDYFTFFIVKKKSLEFLPF